MRMALNLRFLAMFGVSLGLALCPAAGRADFTFAYETTQATPQQSVNFSPANSGVTVVGDTNPAPVYNVFGDLLAAPGFDGTSAGTILHGSGSVVDTGNKGPGFTSIDFRPDTGFTWSIFEFKLDSTISAKPDSSSVNTLDATVYDQNGIKHDLGLLDFPWEGTKGDNQQYIITAINGESMSKVVLTYTPPASGTFAGNTIEDIHNIDVQPFGVAVVPEPASLTLLGFGAVGLVVGVRRKRPAAARK